MPTANCVPLAQGRIVVLHYQLLGDLSTIKEMVGVLLNELTYP